MNSLWLSAHGWQIAGWTMVYFLALGTAVAVVAGVLRLAMRGAAPWLRYGTSLAVFAILAALPLGIALYLAQSPTSELPLATSSSGQRVASQFTENPSVDIATEPISVPSSPAVSPIQPLETSIDLRQPTWTPTHVIELLPWLWLVGTPLTFLLLATGLIGAERLRRASVVVEDGVAPVIVERLQIALGLGRQVAVAVCDRVATPLLVGIVRPLILLPPAALTGWSPEDLEMVLLHELAHVKRWDNLVNLAQRVVESLYFFHPAVWLVSRWVRVDREDCCDAIVVARTAKPQAYAELLVSLASTSQPLAGLAMARHPLGGRIRRILRLPEEPMRVSRGTLLAVGIAIVLVAIAPANLGVSARGAEDSTVENSERAEKAEAAALKAEATARQEALAARERALAEMAKAQAELKQAQKQYENQIEMMRQQMRAMEDQRKMAAVNPDVLQPGDLLNLEVMWPRGNDSDGYFTDDGLTTQYRIESMGTVALGAVHGRVKIAGHDLLEAEQIIAKHLVETSDISGLPKVQLTVAAKAAKKLSGPVPGPVPINREEQSPFGSVEPPDVFQLMVDRESRDPDVLQPGDTVLLRVKGALPEEPLSDEFTIESMGTIALGPSYGRVEIAGKSVLQAENLIKNHLSKILDDPLVQLTRSRKAPPSTRAFPPTDVFVPSTSFSVPTPPLNTDGMIPTPAEIPEPGPAPNAKPPNAPPAPDGASASGPDELLAGPAKVPYTITYGAARVEAAPKPQAVYDGKTFEQWRDLWKTELKTENRLECINALAAFGRAGRGKEAFEAILDVAEQYDFNAVVRGAEAKLHERVLEIMWVESSLGVSKQQLLNLLDLVVDRTAENGAAFRPVGEAFIRSIRAEDADMRQKLFEIAANEDNPLSNAAVYALISSDHDLTRPETVKLARQALQGGSPDMSVFQLLYFRRLDLVPEQFDLLFHSDPQVRAQVRGYIGVRPIAGIIDSLLSILADPSQADKHVDAIRSLRETQRWIKPADKKRVVAQMEQIVREGDEQLLIPALSALNTLRPTNTATSIAYAVNNGQVSDERKKLLRDGESLEQQVDEELNQEQQQRMRRYRGGGGLGGGGGGGFF